MKHLFKLLSILVAVSMLLFGIACDSDDDSTGPEDVADPWIGTWLSTGSNIAPLLVTLFNYDSVRVEFTENTVSLSTHVAGGAWSTLDGTYTITEAASGNVHSIEIIYAAFEQGGIIEVIEGNPDMLKLEVVQTTPDIGAVPRTPDSGFGSDATLGTSNIQQYVRVE